MDVERVLTQLASSLADRADVAKATHLFEHGEWHVGFEVLADNIYEDDIELDNDEIRLAQTAAEFWRDSQFYYFREVRAAETLAASGPCGLDDRHRKRVLTLKYCSHDSIDLHTSLAMALKFPDFYGKNWDAFWDAITGLVAMPHCLALWDWDVLKDASTQDAFQLLRCLVEAKVESPEKSATIELWDSGLNKFSPTLELAELASV